MQNYKADIAQAIKLVLNDKYQDLAQSTGLWNSIDEANVNNMEPYEDSFDDLVLNTDFNPTPGFKHSMVSFLNDCLLHISNAYVQPHQDVVFMIQEKEVKAYYVIVDDKIVIFYSLNNYCYSAYWCIDRDTENGWLRAEIADSILSDMLTRCQ